MNLDNLKSDPETLAELYDEYIRIVNLQVFSKDIHPHAIAAILMRISLELYRTSFNDEMYNRIVDKISEDRDLIKPFQAPEEVMN